MQVSACVTMVLSSILCLLLKTARGTGFKSIEVTVKYTDHHERNLSCHRCTRSLHGDNCLTMEDKTALDIQHCPKDKTYCRVERRWQDGEFVTFMRDCAETCQQGCQSVGAGVSYVVKLCYDCCQHDAFCNVQPYYVSGKSRPRSANVPGGGAASQARATPGVATALLLCLWVTLVAAV